MANNNHVDPVEGVSAVSNQDKLLAAQQDAAAEEARWKKACSTKDAAHVYSCFLLVIEILNHIGLDRMDGAVIAQSQLMDVEHKIQQCVIKISKAISDIQSNEAGYHVYQSQRTGYLSADTYLGLKTNFYNMPVAGEVGPSYSKDVGDIENAIGQLYFSVNADPSTPTVGDLSKIVNPNVWQNGKDFDMTGFWSELEGKYKAANLNNPYGTSYKMVSSEPSDKASLLQQYMFYKAQSVVYNSSSNVVDGAQGQIKNLVNFDPASTEEVTSNSDPLISQTIGVLNLFKTRPSVQTNAPASSILLNSPQEDLLQLMLEGKNTIYGLGSCKEAPGVFATLNYEAYNSYWSKAGADKSAQDLSNQELGNSEFWGWTKIQDSSGHDYVGTGASDVLGSWYTQTNSVQSSIGSDTSTNSTTMQAMTANEGSEVNVGQNAIKALNQYVSALTQNQRSA